MFDVAIIGGGVVGALTARTLSRYRLKICVLEKENDVACGTSKANSAIVHAGFDAKEGSLKAKLNVLGSEMMEEVCRELGVKYRRNGALVIGYNKEDRELLELLLKRGVENGVKELYIAEKEELLKLEPNLSQNVTCALVAPTSAIVCPYELTVAAMGNAMDNGVELFREFAVDRIETEKDGYTVFSGEKSVKARFVVNCAGLYSDKIARMIGDDSFTVTPRKGEYMLLDKECGGVVDRTIFRTPTKMGKGILVSPTVDGNLILGPTSVDMSDKENTQTTREGLAEVVEKAKEMAEGIPFGKVITSFTGLRSVGSTGDFILTHPQKGFFNAGGVESPGLSASPAIAKYLVEQMAEDGLELIKNESFDPHREAMHAFREASPEEKNRIIQQDPAYGKIVCRCERVTLGEILAAIHKNPGAVDMDGVKRRTRAQMGRCQGGFCGPNIMEILAKELHLPTEQVTKNGKGSYMAIGKTKEGKQ